jgi:(2R)-3-sulfolactate dehydrogenase (NADP+)
LGNPLFSPAQLADLIVTTLERCKTSPANAISVARALVDAELAGQSGHGLRRVPTYAAQSLNGKVDGHAVPSADKRAPASLVVDAAHGFAYPAIDLALEHLATMARQCGIAIAGIRNSHHCGVAGLVPERLAQQGLIGLMVANSPAAMAPWGGKTGIFGTYPIAFAAPLDQAEPLVVDVSLSKVARGKVMAAKQKGESIPEGWALAPDGSATTDPDLALAGTMVPMGDAKGTALALMVELLSAGLPGATYAAHASSFLDDKGPPPGTGQTIIAIDPAPFGGVSVLQRFRDLADQVEAQDGARLPGRRRQALKARLESDGIAVDPVLIAEIEALGS